jgi:hypothetical protein
MLEGGVMGRTAVLSLFAVLCLAVPSVPEAHAQKLRIESADELPRHIYPVPESAVRLMEDDSQFAALAGQMRSDLLSDLARYEIGDHATLKQYFTLLGSLALIDGDLDGAVAWADSVRRIEHKPGVRALVGTLERAMRDAATAAEAQRDVAFREAYSREISALEWNEVQAELRTLKGFTEMGSAAAVRGYIQAQVEPWA